MASQFWVGTSKTLGDGPNMVSEIAVLHTERSESLAVTELKGINLVRSFGLVCLLAKKLTEFVSYSSASFVLNLGSLSVKIVPL